MPIHLLPTNVGRGARPRPNEAISRRGFLAGMVLGGTGLVLGCSRPAGSFGNAGGWHAWASDTHVGEDPSASRHGENMLENLRAVVSDILHATDPPRRVVFNGDLALHDGQPGDYRVFLEATRRLRDNGLPIHLTLGNHDDRKNFRRAIGDEAPDVGDEKYVGVVETPEIRYLMLDSQNGVNVSAGLLGEAQRAWLADRIDEDPAAPTIIFVHHNINAHSESALTDTEAFLDVIRDRRQVKAVVFGHTHVWNCQKIDDIYMINLPAVGYRFMDKQPLGWCEFRPAPDGGELELRCIGGDRRKDGQRIRLQWRPA